MKKFFLFCLCFICVLFSCKTTDLSSTEAKTQATIPSFFPEEKNEALVKFEDVLEELTLSRKEEVLPKDFYEKNKSPYVCSDKYYENGLTEKECRSLQLIKSQKKYVLKEDMKEDVEILFRAFRYSMGRYEYFGGDKIFFEAKEKILAKIDNYYLDPMPTQMAINFIIEELTFITDCHCKIGGYSPFYDFNSDEMVHSSYQSGILLGKDDFGFYEKGNSENRYLGCDNENVFINFFLENSGEISYSIVLYCTPNEFVRNSKVKFSQGEKEVSWSIHAAGNTLHERFYFEVGNIAYVSLVNDTGNGYGQYYRELGEKAKKKDIVIIDIRGNGGVHCFDFLSGFTTKEVNIAEVGYERQTLLSHSTMKKGQERTIESIITKTGKTASIPNLIVVLIDNKTGCASEEFSQYCKMFENAIIVGSNTTGHLDGGSGYDDSQIDTSAFDMLNYSLPNSGIPINFSNCCTFFGNFESRMGLGFKPDFYVSNTSSALSSVLNLLVNCGLADSEVAKTILTESGERLVDSQNIANNTRKEITSDVLEKIMKGIDNSVPVVSCSMCSNNAFEYKNKINKGYFCTRCNRRIDHTVIEENFLEGVWDTEIAGQKITVLFGDYDSSNKYMCRDGKISQSHYHGNFYNNDESTALLEFLDFDNDLIFLQTICSDKWICKIKLDNEIYENVVLTRRI